jgi:hypothetical protein
MKKDKQKKDKVTIKIKIAGTDEDKKRIAEAQEKLGTLSEAETIRQLLRKGHKVVMEEET